MTSNCVRAGISPLLLTALLLFPIFAAAQKPASSKENIAVTVYQPKHLYWEPKIAYASVSLRVVGPGGFIHDQDFGTGIPAFILPAAPGVADGQYFYELVFGRTPDSTLRAAIARGVSRDDPVLRAGVEALRATYSGTFRVAAGQIVSPDLKEPAPQPGVNSVKAPGGTIGGPKDQVIPDDLIVQGSLCVGLDCVNNESFGFDTIRLKENNTRIKFDDTSTSAGFPANDWQLTANDSASGGSSKFSIEDITGSKVPFTITAGAATNSIFVDSTGRVGLRTSTPVLDVHARTGNTPALRFEQDLSGGFTPQTWDVAGNEANFFVRDVTGGSKLPFRIRPGAPTSSIDINASGFVGIGTASPSQQLTLGNGGISINRDAASPFVLFSHTGSQVGQVRGVSGGGLTLNFGAGATEAMRIDSSGNIGIGTTPAARLHSTGSVRLAGVASCSAGIVSNASGDLSCLVSSRQFKNVEGDLTPVAALANVMALRPQVGSYKATPDEPEHWLIAEEVAAVDPALVGLRNGEPYTVKLQGIITDLVAVIQEQQRRIEALEQAIAK